MTVTTLQCHGVILGRIKLSVHYWTLKSGHEFSLCAHSPQRWYGSVRPGVTIMVPASLSDRVACGPVLKIAHEWSDIVIFKEFCYHLKMQTQAEITCCNFKTILAWSLLNKSIWPAKLLNCTDINYSVVEVIHELWHIFVQESFVCMHRISCT